MVGQFDRKQEQEERDGLPALQGAPRGFDRQPVRCVWAQTHKDGGLINKLAPSPPWSERERGGRGYRLDCVESCLDGDALLPAASRLL